MFKILIFYIALLYFDDINSISNTFSYLNYPFSELIDNKQLSNHYRYIRIAGVLWLRNWVTTDQHFIFNWHRKKSSFISLDWVFSSWVELLVHYYLYFNRFKYVNNRLVFQYKMNRNVRITLISFSLSLYP